MSREEEIREKAKSLYYNFCVRETCEGEEDCTNCSYGKVIEPLVSIAKWADQHPSIDTIKKIICYALKNTNIMLAEDLENSVEWELLIKKAMEE